MSNYATCPHCDCDIFLDYCFATEYYDNGEHISSCEGHCLECGKIFRWKEVYLFDRVEELAEVE